MQDPTVTREISTPSRNSLSSEDSSAEAKPENQRRKSRCGCFSSKPAKLNSKVMKRDKYIIDPEASRWLWKWDLFGGVLLVVVALLTPFEAGFLTDNTGLSWFNNLVNLFFFMDCLMQFFLGFEKNTKYGSVWVFKRKAIIMHYLTGWFAIDFVSVIPYGLLLPGSPVGALKVIRMIRLTKLLKLVRGARLVRRWQAEIGFSYRHGALYLLLLTVLIIAHWLSCLLGLIHRVQVEGGEDICANLLEIDCTESWLTRASLKEQDSDYHKELSPWDAYLVSLHMAMSMLVHPHSNVATSPGERLAFIILTLASGFVWTQVISRSTAIRTSIDRNHLIYHQTMDDVNNLSKQYHLSWDTRLKLRKFFMKTRNSTQADTWRDLTRRMSPQLRRDAAREINRTWIKRINFLSKCMKHVGFVTDISQAMHVKMYAERESFGEMNTMYVMVEGLATRLGSVHMLTPGDTWGDDHLLLNNPDLLEDNIAVSMTFVEVQILIKEDFDEILQNHDEPRKIIQHTKLKYVMKRGIVLKAREVKRARKEAECNEDNSKESREPEEAGVSESILDSIQRRKIQRANTHGHLHMDETNGQSEHLIAQSESGMSAKALKVLDSQQQRITRKQDEMEVKLNIILGVLQKAYPMYMQDFLHEI